MQTKTIASLFGATLASAALSQAASASLLMFDPDGAGPNPAVQVASFDLLPGNSLNQGVLTQQTAQTGVFTNLFQAKLGSLLDTNGNVIPVPGLNSSFEITVVAQFDLAITGITPGPASITQTALAPTPNNPTNFVRFYYDGVVNANDLAGTGFKDGTMILDATATAAPGVFMEFFNVLTGSATIPPVNLDQFGANNWAGTTSNTGQGSTVIDAAVGASDSSFFIDGLNVVSLNAVTANSEPFNKVNPSRFFFDTIPSNVGNVNGQSGPDILVQTDASVSFVVVPEPASVAMMALSGLAMGLRIRRRKA